MPRIRKTSLQPKRKLKKAVIVPEKIYPQFIEDFRKELSSKTPFFLKIDEYGGKDSYQIGILQKIGGANRCIWMVDDARCAEHLSMFWKSETYKKWTQQSS